MGMANPGIANRPSLRSKYNIYSIILWHGKPDPGCWMHFGMFPSLLCLFVLMYAGKGSRVQHFFFPGRGGAAAFQESLEAVSDY